MSDLFAAETAFFLFATLLLPFTLAKFVVRASWTQALLAFPVFWTTCFLLLGFGRVSEEVFGWTLIMQLFWAWIGVPLCAGLLKWLQLPQRWI